MSRDSKRLQDWPVARSSWVHRLLLHTPTQVSLVSGTLQFDSASGKRIANVAVGHIDDISVDRGILGSRLSVRTGGGEKYSIGGLDAQEAKHVFESVQSEAKELVAGLEEHKKLVARLELHLDKLDQQRSSIFSGNRYIRHSAHREFQDALKTVLGLSRGKVIQELGPKSLQVYDRLAQVGTNEGFEKARQKFNDKYISTRSGAVYVASISFFQNRLTEEQAKAIVTDEDTTLVLAGAGTGKTAVIVGKVAHLAKNQGVFPESILVLAFNRKAAEEIQEKLTGQLASAGVATFHSFGRKVVAESEVAPTISKLATDRAALETAIEKILMEILLDPRQSEAVFRFIADNLAPYKSAFEFRTQYEYIEYISNVELRALSGVLVKSFEELCIANFLTENGIEFEYESSFKVHTATQQYRQYQPDFYLPDYEIYIEHFALNDQGRPPADWTDYFSGVEWKRGFHRQHGSRLIETYSWQHNSGTLLNTLKDQLNSHAVRFRPVSREKLVDQLAQQSISRLSKLLVTFLNHVKTSGPKPDELRTRARSMGDRERNERFLDVFDKVLDRYGTLLRDEAALDFHDLINRATSFIREGKWKSPYRYVLVDEFQDISKGSMALLQSLNGPHVTFFLVGDDWQSIYRFAGSDIRLVRQCGDYLGFVQLRPLTNTFRFRRGILDPSTDFIQRNPEQTRKPLRTMSKAEDHGIVVIHEVDPTKGLVHALREIGTKAKGKKHSVLVLGRYRKTRKAVPTIAGPNQLDVAFSTVHAAKGREADFVVILDLKSGRMGFPSRVEDDPVLELVLPAHSGVSFPFAEERRLFYVALTRARLGVYLVTDSEKPSEFVTEMLSHFRLLQIGESARECPRCPTGRLVMSKSAKNMRCTHFPVCRILAPLCPICSVGYVIVNNKKSNCTNKGCKAPLVACPRCGNGVLAKKQGRSGSFWGCTEFQSQPPCKYTVNIGN